MEKLYDKAIEEIEDAILKTAFFISVPIVYSFDTLVRGLKYWINAYEHLYNEHQAQKAMKNYREQEVQVNN